MHFAIPDTQELIDTSNNLYTSYNIHINGLLHCTLRYSQLHNLHEELLKKFGPILPAFPSKKLFSLTATQQEERRIGLEKYLQIIGQTSAIHSSRFFNRFLFNAQQESINGLQKEESLVVYLNSAIRSFDFSPKLNSREVLKHIFTINDLDTEFHPNFSLFVVAQKFGEKINIHTILRKLKDFESPVITCKRMHTSGIRIMVTIRRNFWDVDRGLKFFKIDTIKQVVIQELLDDLANKRICYPEKFESWQISIENELLSSKFSAQKFKYYGYLRFVPCLCDYPESKSKVTVGIGHNELNLCIKDDRNVTEVACKITRIRCWRLTTLSNVPSGVGWMFDDSDRFYFELSFEYLFPDNKLQWITISSNQAILMSVCLQSMIDELVLKNANDKQESESNDSWVHINTDEQDRIMMENELVANIDEVQVNEKDGVQSNVEKFIGVLMSSFPLWMTKNKNNGKRTMVCKESMEEYSNIVANNPFYMIDDDAL